MRLGIDLDGVVADFDTGWLTNYRTEFGTDPGTPVVWDGLYRSTHFPDMPAFWDWVTERRIFRHLPLLPGALEGLTTLAEQGHDIVIISAKPDRVIPDTLAWIAEHRLPTREIHFREDKHEVACDAYLDDSPVVLPLLVKHHPQALVCRMLAPWNEPVAGTVDVASWSDFRAAVTGHPRSQVG